MRRQLLNDRGYTLTELAITLAVIGIIAAIAYPSYRTLIPRYKYQNDSNLLASQLNLVRLQAVSRNREYRVFFTTADDRYVVYEGNASSGSSTWNFKETKALIDADIYQIESIPGNTLVYKPDGSVDESGEALPDGIGRIYTKARDESMRRRIVVNAGTGRLTVERDAPGVGWKDERYLKE